MESKPFFPSRDINNKYRPPTQSCYEDKGKDQKKRGRRCLVLMTVCFGLISVLLLVFTTLYINISYKQTVEEFIHTIISLQDKNTDLTDLMTEKDQLTNNFNSLSQKKLELETELRNDRFFISSESMSWSESRQYCRDRGADLIIINTEEKQRFITSLFKEDMFFGAWIGLSDTETEGIMKWVDNSPLNRGFFDRGEPNNMGNEDCIEVDTFRDPVNNWNDAPCSMGKKCICEK
ncbi:uncharacterized protein LOC143710454 isoform X1 [Siphateles boraxobius]|uniref:uncharacterized protein LOC143710454 isoform X1 n=1 Tax=Siphateles boraxobius TaxID=180520 RepID=UPI0040649090